MIAAVRGFVDFIARPWRDYLHALHASLNGPAVALHAGLVAVAFALSWWIYVPIHELAHAWGCQLTGGEVTRLEIDWIYGAPLLARFFPYVAVGSDYAGQLTGFDTHGNDLVYLATDAAPFVLTIILGVPLLRLAANVDGRRAWRCVLLGLALPIAYAPFVSLTGDYYEMGSILVSRAAVALHPDLALDRWRSDDLFKLGAELAAEPGVGAGDVIGVAAGFLTGLLLAFATYWLGGKFADLLASGSSPRR
jgi:hypothetical protein